MQNAKLSLVILHGWGVRGETYQPITSLLEREGFTVYAPDLPGFDDQPLPKKVLTLEDYVDFVRSFIKKHIHRDYVVIGHSFGGRVAILLAQKTNTRMKGLILTGAAGIKHPLSLRSKIAFYFAKYGSGFLTIPPLSQSKEFVRKLLYHFIREFDYYRAGELRETFKNIIKDDLSPKLAKIRVPTLIVWGEKDLITPVLDGEFMKRSIPKSRLIIIKNASHRLPYMNPEVFCKACLPFLESL